MTEELKQCMDEAKLNMGKAIDHLEHELRKIRAGRASTAVLEGVMADAYGSSTPINQLANLSTPDSKTISIQPWDKSLLEAIEKGILAANIGLTPQNDGEFIRLNVPPLTEERRHDLVKQSKNLGEHAKISIRNVRKHAMDVIKGLQKDGLGEDMAKTGEHNVQELTNEFTDKVDKHLHVKEEEIMTV